MMSSRGTTIAIVVGLAAFLCVCMLALMVMIFIGFGGLAFYSFSRQAPGPGPVSTFAPLFSATPTPAATQSADEMDTLMDEIEQQVMDIRGLSASKTVERQFMTDDELRDYNLKSFEEDYSREEAADDTRALAAFGLLDPSFELYDFYLDLYSENILGMYDDEAGEAGKLFIISESNRLGAVERATFAHEFQHALQDQNWGLKALGLSEEGWEADSEKSAAAQALVEGEAMVLEGLWQEQYFTQADWDEYYANAYADPDSAYFRAPAFLQKDFYFPYDQGYQFVKRLYDRGGWPEVDAAFKNPPVSTEMILHPEKYDDGEVPQIVAAPVLTDTLGADWRQIDTNVMGEWYTSLILEQQIDEGEAAEAAAGWGGDRYTVSYNDAADQTVVAWHIVWDTTSDTEEFIDAFQQYGDARFGGSAEIGEGSLCWLGGSTCLYFTPQATLWIFAPDAAILEKVRQAVDFQQ